MTEQQLPEPTVAITMSQMYHEFRDLRDEVKHLSTIVDPSLNEVRKGVADNAARIEVIKAERVATDKELEVRIRALENWRAVVFGAAATVGALGGWLISVLTT